MELCDKCRVEYYRLYPGININIQKEPWIHCHHPKPHGNYEEKLEDEKQKERCWCEYEMRKKECLAMNDNLHIVKFTIEFCPVCGRKL